MKEIKKIDVLSLAKFDASVGVIIGLIWGLVIILFGDQIAPILKLSIPTAGLGLASVIISPILYGIVGFIVGAISAFLYNISAKFTGGIKIEI